VRLHDESKKAGDARRSRLTLLIAVTLEIGGRFPKSIFNATPELTWGLMIAVVRHFDLGSRRMRASHMADSQSRSSNSNGTQCARSSAEGAPAGPSVRMVRS
jgi:hypothetical protein